MATESVNIDKSGLRLSCARNAIQLAALLSDQFLMYTHVRSAKGDTCFRIVCVRKDDKGAASVQAYADCTSMGGVPRVTTSKLLKDMGVDGSFHSVPPGDMGVYASRSGFNVSRMFTEDALRKFAGKCMLYTMSSAVMSDVGTVVRRQSLAVNYNSFRAPLFLESEKIGFRGAATPVAFFDKHGTFSRPRDSPEIAASFPCDDVAATYASVLRRFAGEDDVPVSVAAPRSTVLEADMAGLSDQKQTFVKMVRLIHSAAPTTGVEYLVEDHGRGYAVVSTVEVKGANAGLMRAIDSIRART